MFYYIAHDSDSKVVRSLNQKPSYFNDTVQGIELNSDFDYDSLITKALKKLGVSLKGEALKDYENRFNKIFNALIDTQNDFSQDKNNEYYKDMDSIEKIIFDNMILQINESDLTEPQKKELELVKALNSFCRYYEKSDNRIRFQQNILHNKLEQVGKAIAAIGSSNMLNSASIKNIDEIFEGLKTNVGAVSSTLKANDFSFIPNTDEIKTVFLQAKQFLETSTLKEILNNKIGESFEQLGLVIGKIANGQLSKVAESSSSRLIKGVMPVERVAGKELAQRYFPSGNFTDELALIGVNVDVSSDVDSKDGKDPFSNIQIDGKTINFSSIIGPAQGKMDLQIIATDDNKSKTPLRISAKNWSTMYRHTFGSTMLLHALLRTSGGLSTPLNYGYTLLSSYGPAVGQQVNAHKYAQWCAYLDILMGYSQQNNYADTLMILDRNSKNGENYVKFYSIYELVEKAHLNNNPSVLGYNSSRIGQKLKELALESINATSQGIISRLASFKLSVSSSVLK